VITRPIVHLYDQRHTLGTWLDIVMHVRRFTVRRRQRTNFKRILHSCEIARGVGMPQLTTVVTELVVATGTLALQLRATGATLRDDGVSAVRGRAPSDVRNTDERPTQREFLVLSEQVIVTEYHFDV
jgi:hypothetical protein